ncbi:hypothetical protein [Streptomyces cinereoruber]|uniref:hypothetical protein n=1 Tax=Streptomyces cinereoruber TaxID=67260 RepID=UPI00362FBC81
MPREPFVTPEPRAFTESLGVEPVETGEGVLELDLTEVTGEPLRLDFNPLGGSVRLRRDGLDLYREGATHLRIVEAPGRTALSVDFATGTTTGTLRIEVFPRVAVRDELLLS